MSIKRVNAVYAARPEKVGPIDIVRALPNRATDSVGSVIFLDHIPEKVLAPGEFPEPDGSFAHPHRGIATFTYLLKGELIHFDSNGKQGLVKAGGVQWMKAGNGIIHDEIMPADLRANGGAFYGFQFWVNLPAVNKAEDPDYMPVQAEDLPVISLPGGRVKVLLGEYAGKHSPIPTYTEQFIWHVTLKPGAAIELPTRSGHQYAGYLPTEKLMVSGEQVSDREFFLFEDEGVDIHLENPGQNDLDIMIFGGEPYAEPVAAHGPFVMNTTDEIQQAYGDFRQGKYGQINYGEHRV